MPHICSPSKLISCVLSYSLVRLKIHSSHRSTELARRAICPSLQTCNSRIRRPMTFLSGYRPVLAPMSKNSAKIRWLQHQLHQLQLSGLVIHPKDPLAEPGQPHQHLTVRIFLLEESQIPPRIIIII